MLYKEDFEDLKRRHEMQIEAFQREIDINRLLLKIVNEELKTAKPNPNIVDLGDAKVKLKPAGVG